MLIADDVPVEEKIEPSEDLVRRQLKHLAEDPIFRSSKRSVAFLRYVVERTLEGAADQLKERTIGVEVFGREPSYDTGSDHVVRTAASELRKRLAIYYAEEPHRSELRIDLHPGSYVPVFSLPLSEVPVPPAPNDPVAAVAVASAQKNSHWNRRRLLYAAAVLVVLAGTVFLFGALGSETPRTRFWDPVLRASGPVLIAVGDVPDGPPSFTGDESTDMPPSPKPGKSMPPSVPFADTVTVARVTSLLSEGGKQVILRRESASSFSDLRQQPVVLIGAFNNEWSLRLTRPLRFSLAMDPARNVLYIRDRDHPESRQWSWNIARHARDTDPVTSAPLRDYALVSRIVNSETGQVVVVIGGLYTYGTQAAGEFLSDPQLMSLAKAVPLGETSKNLQIVLETDATQETPGPPRIVAVTTN